MLLIDPAPSSWSFAAPIITATFAGIAVCFGAWNAHRIESVKKTAEATHTLSNSAMGGQILGKVQALTASAVVARRLAQVTNSPADFANAAALDVQVAAAATEYQTHVSNQAVVDSKITK